jgi:threonine aldolase
VGDNSHIFIYEGGGAASIGGIFPRILPNEPDGTIRIDSILGAIRADNVHYPVTRVVALENTHNYCGGRVLPHGYLQSVSDALKNKGNGQIVVHLDGARIWNASAASGYSVAECTRGADSISACMSKGLGAPAGSVLMGPKDFIARARRIRKSLGGGMRQVGVLAAACLVGLDDFNSGMLQKDHQRAKGIAAALSVLPLFRIDVEAVDSNIIIVHVRTELFPQIVLESHGLSAAALISRKLREKNILCNDRNASSLRIVLHRDVYESDIPLIISTFQSVCDDIISSGS